MEIDEARENLRDAVADLRDTPFPGIPDAMLNDIEALLSANEIEWDGERSIEYSRDEARVLMAANPGTLWLCADTLDEDDVPLAMSDSGCVYGSRTLPHALLRDTDYVCVGCQTCYEDAPDEDECPDCGRPLVSYPVYWECHNEEELYVRMDGPGNNTLVCPDREDQVNALDYAFFSNSGMYSRITEEEARELREKALCNDCEGSGEIVNRYRGIQIKCPRCDDTGIEPDTQEVENNVEERLSDIEKRLERLEGNDE